MRVVPDTNVLVSAIVFGGPPGRLVELAAEEFGFSDAAAYQAEAVLRRISVMVEPQREVAVITEDPEDDRVLEAALVGDADVIASGNRHLLSLEKFGMTPILSPRALLDRIAPEG